VVHDRSIVRDGELPAGWGLMEAVPGGRTKVVRPAPRLTPEAHPATFRAALLRATAKTNARRGLIVERAIREARDANERAFRAEERLRQASA